LGLFGSFRLNSGVIDNDVILNFECRYCSFHNCEDPLSGKFYSQAYSESRPRIDLLIDQATKEKAIAEKQSLQTTNDYVSTTTGKVKQRLGYESLDSLEYQYLISLGT
jgi:hypothetical protein